MRSIFEWAKNNKFTTGLLLVVIYFVLNSVNFPYGLFSARRSVSRGGSFGNVTSFAPTTDIAVESIGAPLPQPDVRPQPDVSNRKVITDTNLSLLVSDVREGIDNIQDEAEAKGGYMVNTGLNTSEGGTTGNITIRIPTEQRRDMINFLRQVSVRVVSENVSGTDVTDQYVDYQTRLATLSGTKARFEEIMEEATDVDEILRVQNHILNIQGQIEGIKGQLQSLDARTRTTSITIYLATDELELPFAPEQPWRPSVVFKYATRSLIGNLRNIGSLLIWVAVYAPIWIPAIIIYKFARRFLKNRTQQSI